MKKGFMTGQFTLFKQPSSWENCAGWFTSCKQKWNMDLPGSTRAPRFTYISTAFGCHTISSDYQSRTVWTLTLREHIIGGWRDLDILTPHEAHHSSRIMRTYHTHVGLPLGNTSGWWDDRKRNQKPVLPLYLCLDIPATSAEHFLAFAFLAITFRSKECVITGIEGLMSSGHVQMWLAHCLDEEHILLDFRMNILLAIAHSTASWSSHLNMKIAQFIWGLYHFF